MSKITIDLEVEKKRFFKWFAYLAVHFGLIMLIDAHSFPLLYHIVFYSWMVIFLYVYLFIAIPCVVLSLRKFKKDMFG